MRIGDNVKVPFGIHKGESAIIRDIKGTNIWLSLNSEPVPAVLFHIGDFPNEDVFKWLDSEKENKPSYPGVWIVARHGSSSSGVSRHYTEQNAIEALDRYSKAEPGTTFYLFQVVRSCKYEQTLSKQEVIY